MTDNNLEKPVDHAWGDDQTQFFFNLTPEVILASIESVGYETTGRYNALNSMENRVFDVEIYTQGEQTKSVIAKFYRPGRWTRDQILDEHRFLADLTAQEIPVIAPILIEDQTLFTMPNHGLWFCVFPKQGGRSPQDPSNDTLGILGRMLGRIHAVGRAKKAEHRIALTPQTYGIQNMLSLIQDKLIPLTYESTYQSLVYDICKITQPWFEQTPVHRIHGDCHHGNVLYREDTGLFFIDFDDMVTGPAVQDIWLLVSGEDAQAVAQRNILIDAYETMMDFDRLSLRLIEPLRALRYIHFSTWIGKRWDDPSFQQAFPYFGTDAYWSTQIQDLQIQLQKIQNTMT